MCKCGQVRFQRHDKLVESWTAISDVSMNLNNTVADNNQQGRLLNLESQCSQESNRQGSGFSQGRLLAFPANIRLG